MIFILSVLWWIRIRGLWKLSDGRDWLWGNLGLILIGRAMLSKSLIEFSVDGWSCVPSLLFQFSSVQFSLLVVSNSLQPPRLQHARLPCPSPLPELAQIHVHWVGDPIQPSHSLLYPSPPAFKLSQQQGLFQWVGSLHQVAKVLELQFQHQSFQWIFRVDFL